MAYSETGSGKTASYIVPIAAEAMEQNHDAPFCLVVVPTRELAVQIEKEALSLTEGTNIGVACVMGGTYVHRNRNELLRRNCDIVCCTPGRLLDFITPGKRQKLKLHNVHYLVLEEADSLLQMDDFKGIVNMASKRLPPSHRRLLFSATYERDAAQVLTDILFKDRKFLFCKVGALNHVASTIHQSFELVPLGDKLDRLVKMLKESSWSEVRGHVTFNRVHQVLIFVNTKKRGRLVTQSLVDNYFLACELNADYDQDQRQQAYENFKGSKKDILVATNVCARGHNFAGLNLVVNYDLPDDPEDFAQYVCRIGRTGRIANVGRAISFFDPRTDQEIAAYLKKLLTDDGLPVPTFLR